MQRNTSDWFKPFLRSIVQCTSSKSIYCSPSLYEKSRQNKSDNMIFDKVTTSAKEVQRDLRSGVVRSIFLPKRSTQLLKM